MCSAVKLYLPVKSFSRDSGRLRKPTGRLRHAVGSLRRTEGGGGEIRSRLNPCRHSGMATLRWY